MHVHARRVNEALEVRFRSSLRSPRTCRRRFPRSDDSSFRTPSIGCPTPSFAATRRRTCCSRWSTSPGPMLHADRALIYDVQLTTQLAVGLCEWLRPGSDIPHRQRDVSAATVQDGGDELSRTGAPLESSRLAVQPACSPPTEPTSCCTGRWRFSACSGIRSDSATTASTCSRSTRSIAGSRVGLR